MSSFIFRKLYHIQLEHSTSSRSGITKQLECESNCAIASGISYKLVIFSYSSVVSFLCQSLYSAFFCIYLSFFPSVRVIYRFNLLNPFNPLIALFSTRNCMFLYHTLYFHEFWIVRRKPIMAIYGTINFFLSRFLCRRFLAVTREIAGSSSFLFKPYFLAKSVIYPNSLLT